MVNLENHSDAHEPEDDHRSKVEHVPPTGRTRRARIYGSIKRMVSRFWTEDEPEFSRPGQRNDVPETAPPSDVPPASLDQGTQHSEPATLSLESARIHKTPSNGRADTSGGSSPLVPRLTAAADGLTFVSETDAPVEVFVWPEGTPFSPDALRAHEHIDAAEPLETEEVDHFFRNVTKAQDWHEAAEQEQVRRFGALRDLLKAELTDVTVYRFGSTAISVYVLGRAADGTVMGIHTKVVET